MVAQSCNNDRLGQSSAGRIRDGVADTIGFYQGRNDNFVAGNISIAVAVSNALRSLVPLRRIGATALVQNEYGPNTREQPSELQETLLQPGIVVQDRGEIHHTNVKKTRRCNCQEKRDPRRDKP